MIKSIAIQHYSNIILTKYLLRLFPYITNCLLISCVHAVTNCRFGRDVDISQKIIERRMALSGPRFLISHQSI